MPKTKQSSTIKPVKKKEPSTPKPTTKSEWREYLNIHSLQMCPANNAFKERLAHELVKYVYENQSVFFIGDFLDLKGIFEDDYYDMLKECELLAKAHKVAKSIIGRRRELGALMKRLSERTVHFTMSLYSKEWDELEQKRAKLASDDASKETKYVVIEKFADQKD